jgi:hypothetical protein
MSIMVICVLIHLRHDPLQPDVRLWLPQLLHHHLELVEVDEAIACSGE